MIGFHSTLTAIYIILDQIWISSSSLLRVSQMRCRKTVWKIVLEALPFGGIRVIFWVISQQAFPNDEIHSLFFYAGITNTNNGNKGFCIIPVARFSFCFLH
jgi:hypothetical protein